MATGQDKKAAKAKARKVVPALPAPLIASAPAKPRKFDAPWAKSAKLVKFIVNLACHGNVTRAIQQTKISRDYVYDKRTTDLEFGAAWEDARKQGLEVLKDEAWRRAHDGVTEPQFHQGELVGYVRKASDTLLMFLIKQADPTYREHFDVNLGNTGGRPFMFQMIMDPKAAAEATAKFKQQQLAAAR